MADQVETPTATEQTSTDAKPTGPKRVSHDEMLADLQRFRSEQAKAEPAKEPAKPLVKPPVDEHERDPVRQTHDDNEDDDDEDEDEDGPDVDEDEDEDEDDEAAEKRREAKVDPKLDADTQRRLQAIKRNERRARDGLARERAEFEREVREARQTLEKDWSPRVAKVEQYEAIVDKAKRSPAKALLELAEHLGITTDEDREAAARGFFALTKAGREKPENRAYADRLLQDREQANRIAGLESQLEQMQKQLTEKETMADAERQLDSFLDEAVKAADALDLPLVKRRLAKAPERARHAMVEVVQELIDKTGQAPSAKKLLKAYERRLRTQLEEMGLDVPTPEPAVADTKDAKVKKPAVNGNANKPLAKGPKVRDSMREELITELRQLRQR